jgi:hypothetical protein
MLSKQASMRGRATRIDPMVNELGKHTVELARPTILQPARQGSLGNETILPRSFSTCVHTRVGPGLGLSGREHVRRARAGRPAFSLPFRQRGCRESRAYCEGPLLANERRLDDHRPVSAHGDRPGNEDCGCVRWHSPYYIEPPSLSSLAKTREKEAAARCLGFSAAQCGAAVRLLARRSAARARSLRRRRDPARSWPRYPWSGILQAV